MIGMGLGLNQTRRVPPSAFTPASLFAGGVQGAWYDPSDIATLFQDSAGTMPAVVDQPVGRMNDKSGNGLHMFQPTAAMRPILRQAGGLSWLEFDGANDGMETTARLYDPTGSVSLLFGYRRTAAGSYPTLLSGTSAGGAWSYGNVSYFATATQPNAVVSYDPTGSTPAPGTVARSVGTDYLWRQIWNRPATTLTLHHNGQLDKSTAGTNTNLYPVAKNGIGSEGGAYPLNGRIYAMILTSRLLSAAEMSATEAYLATKSGVVL